MPPEKSKRGRKFIKQLPSRLRMGCPNPLNALDECVAALRHVDLTCAPPWYMIRDLQCAGTLMGFRHNSRAYLRHMAQKAVATEGDVLECGSGLSTLLLAITAGRRGLRVHTFEHHPGCHRRLQGLIERYHLRNITVHQTPIRSYGDFDWYDCPPHKLSERFRLVICDGPTRHLTDSGRYGLLPVMRDRLDPHCKVIMDDSHHSLDRNVIHRWRREHGIEVQSFGRFLQFAEITCL
jgi:hypothetical protein